MGLNLFSLNLGGGSTSAGSASDSFKTIQTDAGTAPVATSPTDTLTLTSTDITITGNSTTDTVTFALASNQKLGQLSWTIDGNGSVITTGTKQAFVRAPYTGTITGWELVSGITGGIVVDVLKSTYAGFPPAASIAGSEIPTLTAQIKNQDLSLSTWTTAVTAGDYFDINVTSASLVTKVVLNVMVTR